MTREPDYRDIRAGDEVVIGPLKGVRFWVYEGHIIRSLQAEVNWPLRNVAVSDGVPTIANERGINVYKTTADALLGSVDAINGVIHVLDSWVQSNAGLVLGEVEFWGAIVEYEFGYAAEFVKPTRFRRAWGANANTITDELNTLWFGERHGRNR